MSPPVRRRRKPRGRTPKDIKRMREEGRKLRAAAGITNNASVPDRDTLDRYGNPFDGLSRLKLKYRDLNNDNLATDGVDGRVLRAGTVTDAHVSGRLSRNSVPPLNDLDGSLDGGRLQGRSVPADKLASVDGRDIKHKSIPADAIIAVDWADIRDRPSFEGFVRQAEVKKFLTVQEADKRYRRK